MRAFALALIALPALACHDGLPLDNGDAGVPCDKLPRADCSARADCVVDTCLECSCTPTFVGCRAKSAPPTACPGLGCTSPQCCHTTTDCTDQIGECQTPPVSAGCGICDPSATSTCTTDADCATSGQICDPVPCGCTTPIAMSCQPGCSGDGDCPEPQRCGGDKRCHARACDSTCIGNYDCGADGTCERKACHVDGDCAAGPGYCVNNQCSSGLGECVQPAA